MSQPDLFDMEWSIDDQKNKIEIDSTFLFHEIERQLSEYLLEEKGEGDSTDRAFSFIENLANNLQTEFDKKYRSRRSKETLYKVADKNICHTFKH